MARVNSAAVRRLLWGKCTGSLVLPPPAAPSQRSPASSYKPKNRVSSQRSDPMSESEAKGITLVALYAPEIGATIALVPCDNSQQLLDAYLATVARNNEAASAMAESRRDQWSDTWRAKMREIAAACRKALAELDQHRAEHGC